MFEKFPSPKIHVNWESKLYLEIFVNGMFRTSQIIFDLVLNWASILSAFIFGNSATLKRHPV